MKALSSWFTIAISCLALACSPKGEQPGEPTPPANESAGDNSPDDVDDGDDSGDFMSGAGLMAMSSIFANADKPGIYDSADSSSGFSESSPHMVTMNLAGGVAELQSVSLLGGNDGIELRVIQNRLRELSENEMLKSLLLRVDDVGISSAAAHELRETLLSFKGEGVRKLHCHIESVSTTTYYLLSACDSIGIAPTGGITISGPAAMPMHLKGLLDKVGVTADFLHVGDYKGAAEPLTLEKPSEAMNTTLAGILDQSYNTLVDAIADGRGLPEDDVKTLIDVAMFSSVEAVDSKLADVEAVYEEFRSQSAGELPWQHLNLAPKEEPGLGMIMKLLGMQLRTRDSSEHVAVVYATGGIVDGAGEGAVGASGEIASRTLVPAIHALAEADSVKAVVLRVDSGGGSALASELIWHAMQKLRAKKPVVVSMGGVAASGGYYISCGANKIYADENTLTGSIGVVGGKLAIGGALEKLGIKSFPVGRGKRSMMWSMMSTWNDDERAAIQKMMEDIYKVFVQRVADGRGKSYEEIHNIAQGRVWTGAAAVENGLVDELGGLDEAIAHATILAKMDDPGELEIYPPAPNLLDYLGSWTGGVSLSTTLTGQTSIVRDVTHLLGPEAASVVEATLHQLASFRESAVQTTLFLPVVWRH